MTRLSHHLAAVRAEQRANDIAASLALARGHLLDASGALMESDREDAALLAQHCDRNPSTR